MTSVRRHFQQTNIVKTKLEPSKQNNNSKCKDTVTKSENKTMRSINCCIAEKLNKPCIMQSTCQHCISVRENKHIELENLKSDWTELRQQIEFVFRMAPDAPMPPATTARIIQLVETLCRKDSHQLFLKMQEVLKYVIQNAVKSLERVFTSEIKNVTVGHAYIQNLINLYHGFCAAARRLSPLINKLNEDFLSKFHLSILLLTQHLFKMHFFDNPQVQTHIHRSKQLLNTVNKSGLLQVLHNYDMLCQDMTNVMNQWRKVEKTLIQYNENDELFKYKSKMVHGDWQIFKERRKSANNVSKSICPTCNDSNCNSKTEFVQPSIPAMAGLTISQHVGPVVFKKPQKCEKNVENHVIPPPVKKDKPNKGTTVTNTKKDKVVVQSPSHNKKEKNTGFTSNQNILYKKESYCQSTYESVKIDNVKLLQEKDIDALVAFIEGIDISDKQKDKKKLKKEKQRIKKQQAKQEVKSSLEEAITKLKNCEGLSIRSVNSDDPASHLIPMDGLRNNPIITIPSENSRKKNSPLIQTQVQKNELKITPSVSLCPNTNKSPKMVSIKRINDGSGDGPTVTMTFKDANQDEPEHTFYLMKNGRTQYNAQDFIKMLNTTEAPEKKVVISPDQLKKKGLSIEIKKPIPVKALPMSTDESRVTEQLKQLKEIELIPLPNPALVQPIDETLTKRQRKRLNKKAKILESQQMAAKQIEDETIIFQPIPDKMTPVLSRKTKKKLAKNELNKLNGSVEIINNSKNTSIQNIQNNQTKCTEKKDKKENALKSQNQITISSCSQDNSISQDNSTKVSKNNKTQNSNKRSQKNANQPVVNNNKNKLVNCTPLPTKINAKDSKHEKTTIKKESSIVDVKKKTFAKTVADSSHQATIEQGSVTSNIWARQYTDSKYYNKQGIPEHLRIVPVGEENSQRLVQPPIGTPRQQSPIEISDTLIRTNNNGMVTFTRRGCTPSYVPEHLISIPQQDWWSSHLTGAENVFAPQDVDVNTLDQEEQLIESFKRFCNQPITRERQDAPHINVRGIFKKH